MDEEKPLYLAQQAYLEKYNYQKDYINSEAKVSKLLESEANINFANHILLNFLDKEEYAKKNVEFQKERETLTEKIVFYLKAGHNIACYGQGSKLSFISNLVKEHFSQIPKLTIKGFIPSLIFRNIISALLFLVQQCIQDKQDFSHKRTEFQYNYILENIAKVNFPLILIVIHNIDGGNLREQEIQTKLSQLAHNDKIRFLVSFDHFRYSLLLKPKTKENYNFIYMPCNTGDQYTEEFQYISAITSSKKDKKEAALKFVMESFTKNQKSIVKIVADFVLNNKDEPGITFKQLFQKCLDDMVVSSEMLLKENLLEILDHQVITSNENKNKIYYSMNYSRKALQHIVNDQVNLIGLSDSENNDN